MYTIEIETGNAAFGESPEERGREVARILRKLADRIERDGTTSVKLWDINGNTVGSTYTFP